MCRPSRPSRRRAAVCLNKSDHRSTQTNLLITMSVLLFEYPAINPAQQLPVMCRRLKGPGTIYLPLILYELFILVFGTYCICLSYMDIGGYDLTVSATCILPLTVSCQW